jgi:hypothetical protein
MKFEVWKNWPTREKVAFLLAPMLILCELTDQLFLLHYVAIETVSAVQLPWWTGHGFALLVVACCAAVLLILFLSLLEHPGILVQEFFIGLFHFFWHVADA